jgi:RHS repeat-associated protein
MNTEITSLNWYFHGARYFDPQIARWHTPDPLSESYSSLSPYAYVANNPVNLVDPNGMMYDKPSAISVGNLARLQSKFENFHRLNQTKCVKDSLTLQRTKHCSHERCGDKTGLVQEDR